MGRGSLASYDVTVAFLCALWVRTKELSYTLGNELVFSASTLGKELPYSLGKELPYSLDKELTYLLGKSYPTP